MATKSRNLEDWTSGANLQRESNANLSSQSQKDPEETGALGSSPSHCHLGPWPGGHCLAILIPDAA